jgi:hypothetical protein
MKNYETKTIVTNEISEIICNVCNKTILPSDFIEWQEAQSISFRGGFGSVFGDGSIVSIDICQNCFNEKLGDFVEIINAFNDYNAD